MSEPWDFDATLDRAAVQFADHFARADGESAAVHERVYEYAKAEIARAVAEHDRQVAERAWNEGFTRGFYSGQIMPNADASESQATNPYEEQP